MLTLPMNPGKSAINVPCLRLLAAAGLIWALAPAPAWAQPDDSDDSGDETGDGESGGGESGGESGGAPAQPAGVLIGDSDTLVCNGGWRYSLAETREEIGPARFARQLSLQRDIALVAGAFGYCETAARQGFSGDSAAAAGPCYGLLGLANQVAIVASNLFKNSDDRACQCLSNRVEGDQACEGLREQLPTLRRFDDIIVDRAELALAYEVCASVERDTNSGLAAACAGLEHAVAVEHRGRRGAPGQFSLAAPLPAQVAAGVARVRSKTDGRYLSMLPENFMGVRRSICEIPIAPPQPGSCQLRGLDTRRRKGGPGAATADLWGTKRREVLMGMCNELVLADSNAGTCRSADIYIDERGELHLNRSLTTRDQRQRATLCIDISDFDDDHPLMVTLGLDPTGSVPERVWPGETMHIGRLIDRPVTPQDILRIHVLGKARGVSLAEVLRINGVPGYTSETAALRRSAESRKEACRVARAWVPVVDHEVPVGTPARQAVIPVTFGRGRDGETQRIQEGDYVVLWVRDIEPAGAVLAEYADGQTVGYQPPPLLGEPADARARNSAATPRPGAALRGAGAGVSQPILPRRARYPGSRVLRLGTPEGNNLYTLKVCTRAQGAGGQTRTCADPGGTIIINEKLFVHGRYPFGVRMHFGYSYFPVSRLVGRRTPAAESAGENIFEVVESSGGTADYDVAVLLAVYPLGRDPRRFSYRPWTRTYWEHAALLAGFTVRRLRPWEDFYAGASLPVANGVSLSLLSHFSRRQIPVDVQAGQLFTASSERSDLGLENFFDTQGALVVGASVGLSMDFDLFERAFLNMWERLSGRKGQFFNSSAQPSSLAQPSSSVQLPDSYGDE
jgi:hypothetical protein